MSAFIEVNHMGNRYTVNLSHVVSVVETDDTFRNANTQINTTNSGPILCIETYEKVQELIYRALSS